MSLNLSRLSRNLITSFTYSNDIVTRLSLGSVRDMNRSALWLCKANDSNEDGRTPDGYSAITMRALKYKTGLGGDGDQDWVRKLYTHGSYSIYHSQFLSVRKTLEANMHMADLFPTGRVLWATYNDELHPSHKAVSQTGSNHFLRLFEVNDVEKMYGQVIFSKDMLRWVNYCCLSPSISYHYPGSSHLPHTYDRVLHEVL